MSQKTPQHLPSNLRQRKSFFQVTALRTLAAFQSTGSQEVVYVIYAVLRFWQCSFCTSKFLVLCHLVNRHYSVIICQLASLTAQRTWLFEGNERHSQPLYFLVSLPSVFLKEQIIDYVNLVPFLFINLMDHDSSVGIATAYGLDGPAIESRWGRDFPHQSRPALMPTQPPVQWVPGLSRG